CLARGTSLVGLDVAGASCEALVKDSLLAGGEAPLLDVQARTEERVKLLLLRSTLVSGGSCVHVSTADAPRLAVDRIDVQTWDCVLARPGAGSEGILLDLPEKLRPGTMSWQGFNSLYTGWKQLLHGPSDIDGSDAAGWERYWTSFGVERFESVS